MAIASIWASMAAWFTPTVLFCATNLIIATIFIITSNTTNNKHHRDHSHTPLFSRVSSFLDRTGSIKLPSYQYPTTAESQSHHQHPSPATDGSTSRLAQSIHLSSDNTGDSPGQLVRTPSFLDRVKSFKISSTKPETVGSDPNHDAGHNNVTRSKSEKTSAKKALVEVKKSRSEMRMATGDGEDVELRRPATARERRKDDVDEEVDARADDFISRFKQQLRLQRLESLVRYNETVNRRR